MARWVERYVGVPWVADGADLTGCNCWTLVRLVLREQAGVELPSYGEISALDVIKVARAMAPGAIAGDWIEVETDHSRPLDVVVMRHRRERGHVGIIVPPERLLHLEEHSDSVQVPLNHASVRNRIAGIYRHKALA